MMDIRQSIIMSLALVLIQCLSLSTTSAALLLKNERYQAERQGRYFIISLKQPHRVLSTSTINGGQTNDVTHLVNFQSMEARGHDEKFAEILALSDDEYHQQVAQEINLKPHLIAVMGTAANINHSVHVRESFRETTVDVFVTAGVRGNALRAGDPTSWYQSDDGNTYIKPTSIAPLSIDTPPLKDQGTINIILLINRSLNPGAQAKVVSILNEAKSAALSELAIASTQSAHLATGTGTDQYIVATPLNSALKQLPSASGHLKLGELVGRAVRQAVLESLRLQNGLEPSNTRHVEHALKRFGLNEEGLLAKLKTGLTKDSFALLNSNKQALFTDPKLVANAYAFAALIDRIEYRSLASNIAPDVLLDQAINAALAVSGQQQPWGELRNDIESQAARYGGTKVDYFVSAIALGWQVKWRQ